MTKSGKKKNLTADVKMSIINIFSLSEIMGDSWFLRGFIFLAVCALSRYNSVLKFSKDSQRVGEWSGQGQTKNIISLITEREEKFNFFFIGE